jgi:hypothetical protein
MQLIKNSNKADTTYWTDKELPQFVIVRGKYESLDFQLALTKFPKADSFFIKRLSSQIERFNKTQPLDRVVYHYSRPVFDNSKQYAVVQYDNGHSMLMGGGGIKLYHLEQGVWKELALLVRWSY